MTPARRLVATLAMLAATFAPAGASGQPAAPRTFPGTAAGVQPSIPDVPSGPATIRGRVIHDEEPGAASGVPIILYSMSPNGVPGLRGMVSDADGSFSFEGVTNDPETAYLLGAQYREAPFDIRFAFQAGELERNLELSITDPTADTTGARVADALIQIQQSCAGLLIHESHRVENSGDRVIYIPESERAGRVPILQVVLPDSAGELQSAVGDNLEWHGDTLSYWGPLRPGRHDLEFSYGITARGSSFDLRRTFPSGSRRVRLLSHSSGPTLTPGASDDAELRPGEPIAGTLIDVAFVGSCTNGRISDLREAARVARTGHVAAGVRALVVPGSEQVAKQAAAEGLDDVFRTAGFEWREPGCSMCLAMNPDKLIGQEICASTSNRNFKGRQGSPTGRTLLMSPAMVTAAALHGKVVDVREIL